MLQSRIQSRLDEWVAGGVETGLQVAVIHKGQLIVDAWSGLANSVTGEPVTATTLFPGFSVTKGIAATLVHWAAERHGLDYHTPVAKYWPEFGKNGKASITLRQALDHTAAVPHLPNDIRPVDLTDWDKMTAIVANLSPLWEPGTRFEYHALTSGWIWGEVIRRVDGRDFSTVLRAEICEPLGLRDLHVGIPANAEPRVATLEEIGEPWEPAEPPPPFSSVPNSLQPLYELMNRSDARQACIPAANGIFCARDLARFYAALLPGGIGGMELLPPDRIQTAITSRPLGYQSSESEPAMGGMQSFGHNGHGGPLAFADRQRGFSFAFVRNRLRGPNQPDTRRLLADEIRKAL